MLPLALFAALALYAGWWMLAAALTVPLTLRLGYRTAVRRNGVRLVSTGARRALTGRF